MWSPLLGRLAKEAQHKHSNAAVDTHMDKHTAVCVLSPSDILQASCEIHTMRLTVASLGVGRWGVKGLGKASAASEVQ